MSGGNPDRAPIDPPAVIIDRLLALPYHDRLAAMRAMTEAQQREFLLGWYNWAHGGQVAPPGDWRVWLIRAGRGFGKTRAGAEWVVELRED